MRPKILLLFEHGTLSGGEISMLAILEALRQTEFEFVAAAPAGGMLTGRLKRCGVQVVPLKLRDAKGQKRSVDHVSSHLVELVERVSPDLVHSNSLSMGRMIGRIALQLSIPCTSHLRDIIRLSKTAISDLNRNAGLIAVSNAAKQYHVDQGVSDEKLKVIYNGVDTELFHPGPATGSLRRELGLNEKAVLVANIGHVCLRKGQALLAQAAVDLAAEFPEVNFLFVGQRHSQKAESAVYEKTVRLIFRQSGIENRLFCLGFRQDIPAILTEVDVVVHTAHQEPLGRVLLEAASCGRPIVATDVGGTAEILTNQVSALLVEPNDPEALATATRGVLTDSELRIRLGKEARKTAVEKFSLATAATNTSAFWNSFV